MKRKLSVAAFVVALVQACGGVAGPLAFTISPSSVELIVGETETLSVTIMDANGKPVTGRTVSYSSANPSVATVNSSGVITAVGAGTTSIDLVADGVSGQVSVLVSELSLIINISTQIVPAGRIVNWTATPVNSRGNPVNRTVVWSSGNASVATVTTSGDVEGIAPGQTDIRARVDGMTSDSVISLTVTDSIPSMTGVWSGPVPVMGGTLPMTLDFTQDKRGAFTGRGDFGGLSVGVADGMNTVLGSVSMTITSNGFQPIKVNATFSSTDPNTLLAIFNESGFNNVSVTFTRP